MTHLLHRGSEDAPSPSSHPVSPLPRLPSPDLFTKLPLWVSLAPLGPAHRTESPGLKALHGYLLQRPPTLALVRQRPGEVKGPAQGHSADLWAGDMATRSSLFRPTLASQDSMLLRNHSVLAPVWIPACVPRVRNTHTFCVSSATSEEVLRHFLPAGREETKNEPLRMI